MRIEYDSLCCRRGNRLRLLPKRRSDFSAGTSGSRARWKSGLLALLLEEHLLLDLLLLGDLGVRGDLGGLAVERNFGLFEVAAGIY